MNEQKRMIESKSTMREVLEVFPGAQRALFKRYHIGGCSSCGFQPTETLEELCARNNNLDVKEVLEHIKSSHEQDERIFIDPTELAEWRKREPELKLLDVRSRVEFGSAHIEGSILLSQPVMQEVMGKWDPLEPFVIIDHHGKQALDAAAYFMGHGFMKVRCLRGGIDAWSEEVDNSVPQYELA